MITYLLITLKNKMRIEKIVLVTEKIVKDLIVRKPVVTLTVAISVGVKVKAGSLQFKVRM